MQESDNEKEDDDHKRPEFKPFNIKGSPRITFAAIFQQTLNS